MSNKIKLKRGLSSKINSITLDEGEVALTTDTNKLYSKKGEIAPHNVYVGTSEPSNSNIECWINPNASFDPTAYFNKIYPVGSIYMSVSSTNPSILFGGTWTKIEGRFLWATGNTPKHTGGEAAHTLTIEEMPSHTHNLGSGDGADKQFMGYAQETNPDGGSNYYFLRYDGVSDYPQRFITAKNTGGSQPHNNMPPYFEVYMWYRTK